MEDSRISERKNGQHRKQKQEQISKRNIQRKVKICFLQFQTTGQEIINSTERQILTECSKHFLVVREVQQRNLLFREMVSPFQWRGELKGRLPISLSSYLGIHVELQIFWNRLKHQQTASINLQQLHSEKQYSISVKAAFLDSINLGCLFFLIY